jgi:hypothetical protein
MRVALRFVKSKHTVARSQGRYTGHSGWAWLPAGVARSFVWQSPAFWLHPWMDVWCVCSLQWAVVATTNTFASLYFLTCFCLFGFEQRREGKLA